MKAAFVIAFSLYFLIACGNNDSKTGSVSGFVTDFDTGEIVSEVNVTVSDNRAVTDSTGLYQIRGVKIGRKELSAKKDGYDNYFATIDIFDNQNTSHDIILKPMGQVETIYSSCLDILNSKNNQPDGYYTIDADAEGPLPALAVYCDMTSDGGGWTKLTEEVSNTILNTNSEIRREYLFVKDKLWYRTPASNLVWDWNSGQVLTGTYTYSGGGSFECISSDEVTLFGISCSNGPGNQWKVLIYYEEGKIPSEAKVLLCQDQPGIFGAACQADVIVYIREQRT